MSSKNLTAIIYVRVSTDEQVDNYSLDTQEDLCRKEADRMGYIVSEVFKEEGKSAKTITGRPTMIKMLTYCLKKRAKIDAIFVYRLDRIARDVGDYVSIRKKLFDYGIKLISTREPTGDSPSETFMEQVFAAAAQYDNAVRGERSKNGMYARFKAGLPNAVPIGYVMRNGYGVKDENTFLAVKMAWDLMATGTKTVPEITRILASKGFKVSGRKPRPKDFYRAFKHKFYCGILTSVTYKEEVIGQHEPMITIRQFEMVQKVLDKRYKKATKVMKHGADHPDFPFKKHILCSKCMYFMTGYWAHGRTKLYPYYRCGTTCVNISINANKVHESIHELVKINPIDDRSKKTLIQEFSTRSKVNYKSSNQRISKIDEKISDFIEKRKQIIEKNIVGTYSDEITKEQISIIAKQISDLDIEKKTILHYKSHLTELLNDFKAMLDTFPLTFKNATTTQQKVLLHFLFPSGLIWEYDQGLKINTTKANSAFIEQRRKDAFEVLVEILESTRNYN